ncbi:m-AAA protease-interacting protein 1, mitochondrial-like [Anneissia japonica]|uniref:m-AAA protease-interacting protein 1, mitochondrial-like n=1 Tax=Anneissia japonica TaxID=1529436 RepID=UPI001425A9ED|nr:m-AAA protease-interacting protein 1, mitochondrial-like [Anneissia japonica]XP_033104827.1 m-AAA protease-interacting protein 1, mitochondrial-like [Anneissia japonica]
MRILTISSVKKCFLSSSLGLQSLEYEISPIRNRRALLNNRRGRACGTDTVVSQELLVVNDRNTSGPRPSCDFLSSNNLLLTRHQHTLLQPHRKPINGVSSFFSVNVRKFSSNPDERVRIKPVFVAVPNPIRAIRNFVYSWLIRGYFDKEFSMVEFTEGAKQAVSVVSQKISEGNFEELVGLLSPKTIDEIKETYKTLEVKQRGSLAIALEDILHVVPYNVAVHYDQAGGKFLNILMRFWCLSFNTQQNEPGIIGFKVGQPPPGVSEEQFKNMGKVFTCTFEFHRDVSSDDDPSWTITQVTLGKLLSTSSDGFPGGELQ